MALQDKIGREEIVDKICGLVGSLKKDKNFCLAINGAWGSGKSFVLGLIEEKLSKKQEYIIIKYDAWENTFYSDPLIAILSCVIDGIEEKLYLVERTEEKVVILIQRICLNCPFLFRRLPSNRELRSFWIGSAEK